MTQTQEQIAIAIIFGLFVAGFFAWQGYKRGFRAELVWFLSILIAAVIGNPEMVGEIIAQTISQIYYIFQIIFTDGSEFTSSGDFSANEFAETLDSATIILFIIMLLIVLFGYYLSTKVKKKSFPILGMILGVTNLLLLAWIFIPVMMDTLVVLLQMLRVEGPVDSVLDVIGIAIDLVLAPFTWLINTLGVWSIVIAIVLIVILAARSTRGGTSG